jgi:hypothetical protein
MILNLRKRITVYVTPKKHKELKSFCANIGMSMSNFIDHAIREKIKNEYHKNNKIIEKSNL